MKRRGISSWVSLRGVKRTLFALTCVLVAMGVFSELVGVRWIVRSDPGVEVGLMQGLFFADIHVGVHVDPISFGQPRHAVQMGYPSGLMYGVPRWVPTYQAPQGWSQPAPMRAALPLWSASVACGLGWLICFVMHARREFADPNTGCGSCGYSMEGLRSDVLCPECGAASTAARAAGSVRDWVRRRAGIAALVLLGFTVAAGLLSEFLPYERVHHLGSTYRKATLIKGAALLFESHNPDPSRFADLPYDFARPAPAMNVRRWLPSRGSHSALGVDITEYRLPLWPLAAVLGGAAWWLLLPRRTRKHAASEAVPDVKGAA